MDMLNTSATARRWRAIGLVPTDPPSCRCWSQDYANGRPTRKGAARGRDQRAELQAEVGWAGFRRVWPLHGTARSRRRRTVSLPGIALVRNPAPEAPGRALEAQRSGERRVGEDGRSWRR